MKNIMKLVLATTIIFVVINAISFAQDFKIIDANEYWLAKLKLKVENSKVYFYQMNFRTEKMNIGIVDKNFISFINSTENINIEHSVQMVTYKDEQNSWIYYKNLSDYLESKSNEEANKYISELVGIKVNSTIDNSEIILWYSPEILETEIAKNSDNQAAKYNMQILLFPNPLKSNTLKAKFYSIKPGIYSINIYDINGNEMMGKLEFELKEGSEIEIQVPDIAPGMYALVASSSDAEKIICKFIKDRE